MAELAQTIYDLKPEVYGRIARNGFEYQDHIGVSLCLEMIIAEKIEEIWFETYDDITLIYNNLGQTEIEFVQVKSNDLISRWSISKVTERKNDRVGTSLVEKSFSQYKCTEKSKFRIVTSYDVDNDLKCLKQKVGTAYRDKTEEAKLVTNLKKSLSDYKQPLNKKWDYWVKNCHWDKRADKITDLINTNKIKLDETLKYLDSVLLPDQRNELYQKLLAKIKDASTDDINIKPDCYKIKRSELMMWIIEQVRNFRTPDGGTHKLEKKLIDANLRAYVVNAKSLKWNYRTQRLKNDYSQSSNYSRLENEIETALYQLIVSLDNDNNHKTGIDFHNECLRFVEGICKKREYEKLPQNIGIGYMYDLTNRCLHRFMKAEA